ncbi:extracellular solute-binding protein [Actinosynnema sp. NPDC020468]|uniref:extracellular solute-binding protein n=1 Tax=Actinosynnema sp. NPDC020468 TaxID=3154488 RepID=UPI0033E3EB4A
MTVRGVIAALVVVLVAGCTGPVVDEDAEGVGTITFVDGEDTSSGGQIKAAVDQWNTEHSDAEQVEFEQMPRSTDAYRAQLTARAQDLAGVPDRSAYRSECYDVMSVDMVWTADFARAGYLEPLAPARFGVDRMLPEAVRAATVDGTLWAVPWRADAGLLYYRKDVLDREGLEPPTTWGELEHQARTVAPKYGLDGYLGQFRRYEGLTVNASEAMWAHGGSPDRPADPGSKAGVRMLAGGFADGWIPQAALEYDEEASLVRFAEGKALFLRSWPYAVSRLRTTDLRDRFGRAALPGPAALGGWNLAVSRCSTHQKTARAFIAFLTNASTQSKLLVNAGYGPTVTELYRTESLALLRGIMAGARARPVGGHYDEVSGVMQVRLHGALKSPATADASMDVLAGEISAAREGR